jgi:hypothetical protein
MSDTLRRVREAADNARSNDDLVGDGMPHMVVKNGMFIEPPLDSPLDETTLDELSDGVGYDLRRRDYE